MSNNINTQAGSRLLALPKELRLLIYKHIFPPCKVDIQEPRANQWVDRNDIHVTRVDVAILATCRAIHTEAAAVLYENTEFYIRLLCSGPNPRSMKVPKHEFYTQLLQDLQGRVKSLFSHVRKISLEIVFRDIRQWDDPERTWFQQMTSELARLVEASQLKRLHILFEADEYSGPSGFDDVLVRGEFDHILGVLSGADCRAAVTAAIHPSLNKTNIKLSTYLDALAKLQR